MKIKLPPKEKIRLFVVKNAPKWLKSPIYKILYKHCGHEFILSRKDFSGKRILIIGPARTGPMELSKLVLDQFEVIVKMNNGIFTSIDAFDNEYRCDILFHSLTSDTKPVPLAHIEKCGVRKIIHRLPKRSAFLKTIIEEEKYKSVAEVNIIPYEDYQNLSAKLDGYSPSTGLVCANFFLNSDAAEVALVGFTFFSTSYVPGYDVNVRDDEGARNRVELAGHHSPRHEARLMSVLIDQAQQRGVRVVVGSEMRDAILRIGSAPPI